MKKSFLIFLFAVISVSVNAQVEYSSRLAEKLEQMSNIEYVRVLCLLRDRVDIEALDKQLYAENASLERRAYEVITRLQEKANITQTNLKNFLASKVFTNEVKAFESLWVTNLIVVEATKPIIQELLRNSEIESMDIDAMLRLDPYVNEGDSPPKAAGTETGLKVVGADKVWKLGITGAGSIVMGIDTGVEGTHPAFVSRWRGNFVPASQAWFDPETSTTSPNDCDSHGTHTMGTMCGRAGSDTIGMAFDAQWIAAKTICSSPATSKNLAAFQWAMNPDGNPSTIDDMPTAINNSWYDPNTTNQCSGTYKTTFDAVEAAGIAIVFSAGNNGPNASTITMPKNINTDDVNVFCVANVNGNTIGYPIASSSSRGPSTCGGTGSLLIKPEVSAPGTSVRSATLGGSYGTKSGTSMASPHVVGAIALLKQAAPHLTGRQLKLALYNTAVDLGEPGEDNTYGKGIIDVYAALLYLGSRDSIGPTRITNLAVTAPGSNSLKLTWTAPHDTSPGGVTQYDIRYTTSGMITDTNSFNSATKILNSPKPDSTGMPQSINIAGLASSTTYNFAIRSRDVWGNWSEVSNSPSGVTLANPNLSLNRDSLSFVKPKDIAFSDSVMVSNTSSSPSTLDFEVVLQNHTFPTKSFSIKALPVWDESMRASNDKSNNPSGNGISIEGSGGPDLYGYRWKDSDEASGPRFTWSSISTIGTAITLNDDAFSLQTLPFNFNFYGNNYNSVEVVSNGYLRFTNYTTTYPTNGAIPATALPNNGIYGFWDDLAPNQGGNVYVYSDAVGGKFIVEYNNVARYNNTTSRVTFQIELQRSGSITYRYLSMVGTMNSATIGIENSTGTDGLQVVYNNNYVKDSLAIKFQKEPEWLNLNRLSGSIAQGNSLALVLQMNTAELLAGIYRMEMKVTSNDTSKPTAIVPVRLMVIDSSASAASSFSTQAGWNLISIPLQAVLKTKSDLFPTSNSNAYGYSNVYTIKDTLELGYGYWLKFPSNQNHTIFGNNVSSTSVPLNSGWNMIGSLNDSITISTITTTPPGILASVFYGYNSGYYTASVIEKGKGYWIKSNNSGTLNLSTTLAKDGSSGLAAFIDPDWPMLRISDASGNNTNLYLSNSSVSEIYELPPAPPIGIFDARFTNNKFAGNINETNLIQFSSSSYPIEIEVLNSKSSFKIEDVVNGNLLKQTLSENQKIIVTNPAINSVRLNSNAAPTSYSLDQNYPNPFNPSTNIKFQIPITSKVSLVVYDVLGREVASLVNEVRESGVYNVIFNSEQFGLSSGIYFYRLVVSGANPLAAGEFTSIKKLILMK